MGSKELAVRIALTEAKRALYALKIVFDPWMRSDVTAMPSDGRAIWEELKETIEILEHVE
jgi:hypothetical protein